MKNPLRLLLTILLPLAACAPTQSTGPAAQNANTPGWTGSTTVIGNTSTIAGDAAATNDQQKWPRSRP